MAGTYQSITVENQLIYSQSAAGVYSSIDGAAQKIIHQASDSSAFMVLDGAGNTIYHYASQIGLGVYPGSDSTLAAMRNVDISQFEQNLHGMRFNDLKNLATATAQALASASPPVTLSPGAIIALITSLAHITVPGGSQVVQIASSAPSKPPSPNDVPPPEDDE